MAKLGGNTASKRLAWGAGMIICALIALQACEAPVTQGPIIEPIAIAEERAKQKEIVEQKITPEARTYSADLATLQRVGFQIATSNAEICSADAGPIHGFTAWNKYQYRNAKRQQVTNTPYQMGEGMRVVDVVAGGPAAAAGLQPGDLIDRVDGQRPQPGVNAADALLRLLWSKPGDVTLTVNRDGAQQQVTVTPVRGCQYGIFMPIAEEKNAFANGRNIMITTGMMEFIETEQELALVVAHELAHNAMSHVSKTRKNATVGQVAGIFLDVLVLATTGVDTGGAFQNIGGNTAILQYSADFEREADYVGMYMLARAGFETEGVAAIWRRMATLDPKAINISTTHPTTPERFVTIEETAKEIAGKRSGGLALMPTLSPKSGGASSGAPIGTGAPSTQDAFTSPGRQ